jgi:hypothetical protein
MQQLQGVGLNRLFRNWSASICPGEVVAVQE